MGVPLTRIVLEEGTRVEIGICFSPDSFLVYTLTNPDKPGVRLIAKSKSHLSTRSYIEVEHAVLLRESKDGISGDNLVTPTCITPYASEEGFRF